MAKIDEFSINNLISRVGSSLASDLTRYYSKERRIDYKMANTPRFTKLVDTFYDKVNDSITFTFLTYATPKPQGNVETKFEVDPLANFAFDKNDLKIYEIMMRFFNVSSLMSIEAPNEPIRKSRARPKATIPTLPNPEDLENVPPPEPDEPEEEASIDANFKPYEDENQEEVVSKPMKPSTLGEARVTSIEAKQWLYNADFALWSNSPSFHWQGFNYKLSQLEASIFPTNIAPTSGPKGWSDRHGNALVDKHLLELFVHIKFFINQMASSMLNKIRSTKREHSMSYIHNKLRESTNIKINDNVITFECEGEPYVLGVIPDTSLKYNILDVTYKQSEADYKFQFYNKKLSTEQRIRLYNAINSDEEGQNSLTCVGLSVIGKGTSLDASYESPSKEELTPSLKELTALGVNQYIDELSPDIFSFHATDMDALSKFILSIVGEVQKEQDQYIVVKAKDGQFSLSVYLIKKEAYGFIFGDQLTEAEMKDDSGTSPPPDEGDAGMGSPEGDMGDAPPEDDGIDEPTESDVDSEPKKVMVCSVATCAPLTKDHIPLLKKLVQTAKEQNTKPVLFVVPQDGFKADDLSMRERSSLLRDLFPTLKIVESYGELDSVFSSLVWAYGQKITDITLVSGSNQLEDFIEILNYYNGRVTKQGKFEFAEYDVVSYGGDNPDTMDLATQGRNAILNQDAETFSQKVLAPHKERSKNILLAKKQFMILSYEQEHSTFGSIV